MLPHARHRPLFSIETCTVAIMRSRHRSVSSLVAPTLSEMQMMQVGRSKTTDTTSTASPMLSTRLAEPVDHGLLQTTIAAAWLRRDRERCCDLIQYILYTPRGEPCLVRNAVIAEGRGGDEGCNLRSIGIHGSKTLARCGRVIHHEFSWAAAPILG